MLESPDTSLTTSSPRLPELGGREAHHKAGLENRAGKGSGNKKPCRRHLGSDERPLLQAWETKTPDCRLKTPTLKPGSSTAARDLPNAAGWGL